MRKIIYSPGYGAGWTTWHGGSDEEKRFMLEYQPFIEALERGEELGQEAGFGKLKGPLIDGFKSAWKERFPGADLPYMGGLRSARVAAVHGRVRINEYDGNESIEEEDGYDGWL